MMIEKKEEESEISAGLAGNDSYQNGETAGYGNAVLKSLLDLQKTPTNDLHEETYAFDIKDQFLSPFSTHTCQYRFPTNYYFGTPIGTNGCGWIYQNRGYDLILQGNAQKYYGTSFDMFAQNYEFTGTDTSYIDYRVR
jgi:uncharacterized protein (UPF0335 family)